MKKNLLFLFLVFSGLQASAQFKIDAADFQAKFKSIFEMARKRFVTEKTGDKQTISEGNFVAQYKANTTYNNAKYSRIVIDTDGLTGHDTRFHVGTDKEAAKKVLTEMTGLIKSSLPPKFIIRESYEGEYLGGMASLIEFDSEVFAQQAKQPSGKFGIKETKDGNYFIDIVIFEPIFK